MSYTRGDGWMRQKRISGLLLYFIFTFASLVFILFITALELFFLGGGDLAISILYRVTIITRWEQ